MLKVTPIHPPPDRIKLCTNCKHAGIRMTPQKNEIKCRLYYTLDLVTGDKAYENAHAIRQDTQKCGPQATYFEGLTQSDNIS